MNIFSRILNSLKKGRGLTSPAVLLAVALIVFSGAFLTRAAFPAQEDKYAIIVGIDQ